MPEPFIPTATPLTRRKLEDLTVEEDQDAQRNNISTPTYFHLLRRIEQRLKDNWIPTILETVATDVPKDMSKRAVNSSYQAIVQQVLQNVKNNNSSDPLYKQARQAVIDSASPDIIKQYEAETKDKPLDSSAKNAFQSLFFELELDCTARYALASQAIYRVRHRHNLRRAIERGLMLTACVLAVPLGIIFYLYLSTPANYGAIASLVVAFVVQAIRYFALLGDVSYNESLKHLSKSASTYSELVVEIKHARLVTLPTTTRSRIIEALAEKLTKAKSEADSKCAPSAAELYEQRLAIQQRWTTEADRSTLLQALHTVDFDQRLSESAPHRVSTPGPSAPAPAPTWTQHATDTTEPKANPSTAG